ncbi:MAG: SCO family protein [Steroidobacteraceae bacterium]|jgi:protein SCO1/2
MKPRLLLMSLALAVLAAAVGAGLARLLEPAAVSLQAGTWLAQPRALAEFHLQDLSGRDFDRSNLHGHPTLLFFGFTHCPDVCPTTLAMLAQLQRARPLPDAQVVFVTVDPERDSAASLQVYLAYFDHGFIGLRGDQAALAPLLSSLSAIAVRQSLPDGSYTMDHSATLYLLDSAGRLVAVFSPPFSASAIGADLRQLRTARRV